MTDDKFRAEVRAELVAEIAARKTRLPLDGQIKFQRHEIEMRERTLRHLVSTGKMRFEESEREISNMRDVLDTLEQVQRAQQFRKEG
jgi:hypothetical protein